MTTRVAAFDCGTNSLRLLIAAVDVERRMEIVRLGQGVDRTGMIAADAMARALAVTGEYARACRSAGVRRIRFVATSATRDAGNREEFVAGVQGLVGVTPEVITGAEEAALSFAGATHELRGVHTDPFLVVDIGGGSTEFVLGRGDVEAGCSVDIGCVRMTERHLTSDPPTAAEIAAATADVDAAISRAADRVPLNQARTVVGLAGSVTTVTAHALGLDRYDATAIHRATVPVDDVLRACEDLLTMRRERRAALPYMHPGRVDVIGAGALIWRRIIERVAAAAPVDHVVTSEHDILDGIAWSIG
jgi:exopolyphosphatase / guanosine-5'-triphosphate,3'-diphosphate pyrophosphatase